MRKLDIFEGELSQYMRHCYLVVPRWLCTYFSVLLLNFVKSMKKLPWYLILTSNAPRRNNVCRCIAMWKNRMIFERILNHIKIKSHVWSKLERHRINKWENTHQKSLCHMLCADLLSVFKMKPLQALLNFFWSWSLI